MPETNKETPIIDEDSAQKLQRFKDELALDSGIIQGQREAAAEDMRFANTDGGMWLDWEYSGKFDNRVKLELDMVSDFRNRTYGEFTLSNVGVDYRPTDDAATDKDADNLSNVFRSDFRDNSGRVSVNNAVGEVYDCGYGAIKIGTIAADESDPLNKFQNIEFRPKYNAYETTIWDGGAERIDKRDATRCVELVPFTKEAFEAKYPGENPVSAYVPDTYHHAYSRAQNDLIYIAIRYDIVERKEKVFVYNNLNTDKQEFYYKEDHEKVKDELAADNMVQFVEVRPVILRTVEKSEFSGDKFFIESQRIVGKLIPIVPFYGHRTFVGGVEHYKGLIRDLKDAARVLNMLLSLVAENAASGHSQIPVFTRDQIPNDLVKFWADNSNGPPPYRLVDPVLDADANPINSGPVTILPAPQIDANVKELINITILYLRERTGSAPQETLDPKASGKAINAIIKRVNMNVQPITDNISIAIQLLGDIYASMFEELHTENRMKSTLSKDGTSGRLEVNRLVLDDETGTFVKSNTFGEKGFKAYAESGQSYGTAREEEVEDLKGMADAVKGTSMEQEYLPAIFAGIILASPGSNDSPVKKIARRSLLLAGHIDPESDEEKQLVQQAQQQSQQSQENSLEASLAEQAKAEARERESKVRVNIADANKKTAETQEIISKIETDKIKTFAELRKQIREEALALQPN